MDYITEIKAFYDFVQTKQLSTGQIALWHALMHLNNKCAWNTWFTAPNLTLQLLTGLSRKAISDNRNVLKQLGLIEIKSNGTKATSYRINSRQYSKQQSIQQSKQQSIQQSMQESIQDTTQDTIQDTIQDSIQDTATLNRLDETRLDQKNDTDVSSEKRLSYGRILELYHAICTTLPRVTTCTDARKQRLRILLQEFKNVKKLKDKNRYEQLEYLFRCVQESDFLCGRTEKDWKCTFDWIITKSNAIKIIEGNYANRREQHANGNRENHESNQYSDEVEQAALEQFRRLQMQEV